MPEYNKQSFAAYMDEIDFMLKGLPLQLRKEIQSELRAHLEDAAEEQGISPDDCSLQTRVINELGASVDVGTAFYEVYEGEYALLKRLLDICISCISLILLSLFFLVIAILVKISSQGPVLYRDSRTGKHGSGFAMYKFRTMRTDNLILPTAVRVTRVGRFLRSNQLDELPQLFNILKGEMSFVGPRPIKSGAIDLSDPVQRRLLLVRPGVISPSYVQPEEHTRLEADRNYIEQLSLSYDLHLLRQVFDRLSNSRK